MPSNRASRDRRKRPVIYLRLPMLTIFLRRHKEYLLRRLLPQKATGKQCAQTATAIRKDGRRHSARSERRSLCVDWVLTSDPDGAHGAVHAAWLH